jgi:hypothetical protein
MSQEEKPLYSNHLDCDVTLVGAGGIGSNLLPLIVRCGPRHVTVWDPDVVKPVNLAAQNFKYADIGCSKVGAITRLASAINPDLPIVYKKRRFSNRNRLDGLVIAGVDSMQSRRTIFSAVCRQADRVDLFIDGRLSRSSPEWVELYFIDPKKENEVEAYREWLYADNEVGPKGPRPKQLSAHTPILLAGLLGAGLARWVHERRHPWKVTLDASTFTLAAYWEA